MAGQRDFDKKVVVVTGATAGVGRAVARRFAQAGAVVALIARDEHGLDETRRELEALGARSQAFPLDVADADAVFAAADQVEARLGPIDVWVNNAMVTVYGPVAEITPEEFRRVTEVTYLGYVHGTMAALKRMRRRERGTILQVGSALAYRGIPLQAAYCGAKHAIRGFTDSLRSELIHDGSGVKLTMVQLPAVNTPQFSWARVKKLDREPRPVPPVFQPEAIADAILAAARSGGREYWIGGSTVQAILGAMVVPSWLDRYLAKVAYAGQQGDEPLAPGRDDNLNGTVPALHSAHGSFDGEASKSVTMWSEKTVRLGVLGLGAVVFAAVTSLAAAAGRQPRRRHVRWR